MTQLPFAISCVPFSSEKNFPQREQLPVSSPACVQVGGVVTDQGEDRLEKLMNLLQTMMNERKERFRGGNFSQYIQVYGQKIPAVFVVIDNYAAFREKTKDRYESTVMRIAREGIGYGIYLILSAGGFGISEIPSRLGDQIRTVISLEMPDKFRYMETLHLTRLPILPDSCAGAVFSLFSGVFILYQNGAFDPNVLKTPIPRMIGFFCA